MNSISWFIYWIQVADNVGWIFNFLTVVFLICFIGSIFVAFAMSDGSAPPSDWKTWRRCEWLIIPSVIVCTLISAFIPSKQTLILIAGAQIGEQVVKSDQAKEVGNQGLDLLKAWIKAETKKYQEKADK